MKANEQTKLERLITSFQNIEEATFWPKDIDELYQALSGKITFKEMNEYLNSDFIYRMNNSEHRERLFIQRYEKSVSDLKKMRNMFSEDIDFI